MSAEGKKRRGESGMKNAESSPFRLNGMLPDWAARRQGCFQMRGSPSSGSRTLRGMMGGALAAAMGYPEHGEEHMYELMMAHAFSRVSHPLLTE